MAKRTTPASSGGLDYNVLDGDAARRLLAESRSGRGGRVSKYQGVVDAYKSLEPGKAIHLRLSKAEVQGMRQYVGRQAEGAKIVSSAIKDEPGRFHVLVMHDAG